MGYCRGAAMNGTGPGDGTTPCWSRRRAKRPRRSTFVVRVVPLDVVRSFRLGMAGSRAMATLVDDLVPDQLWAILEPLLPSRPRPPYSDRQRAIPERNCLPRSSTWLVPPPPGGCCRPESLAAARPRPHGDGWTSGPGQACLTSSTSTSLTGWASIGTTWAQIRSIVASPGPSSTWSATAGGCR
jgi:hypothetical protein